MFTAYDKRTFWRSLLGFIIAAVLMKATNGAGLIVVAVGALISMASGNIRRMFYCLLVANCALLANSYFFPKGFIFGLTQRGMLAAIGVCLSMKVFGGKSYKVLTPFIWILPYLLYMTIPSAVGWSPIVSFLKITLFTIVFIGYYGVAMMALSTKGDFSRDLRAMVVASSAFFIVGSVLLIPFPGISYMGASDFLNSAHMITSIKAGETVSLFKGMTNHSQMLGPLVSVFCVFLLGDMLFNIRKVDKLYVALILMCPILIYKTSSRGAMAVLICGVLAELFLFQCSRSISRTWKAKIMNVAVAVGIFALFMVVLLPSVRNGIVRYIIKYSKDDKVEFSTEEMLSTRQRLMDDALYHWRQKPMIGNGFQVSEQMQFETREGLQDYISAPVEKGVWVTAVLEEGGVIGMILFCSFWISATLSLWSGGFYSTAAMLLSFVVLNMAEFTIFSMSGSGGFVWAIIFILAVLDGKREMGRIYLTRKNGGFR